VPAALSVFSTLNQGNSLRKTCCRHTQMMTCHLKRLFVIVSFYSVCHPYCNPDASTVPPQLRRSQLACPPALLRSACQPRTTQTCHDRLVALCNQEPSAVTWQSTNQWLCFRLLGVVCPGPQAPQKLSEMQHSQPQPDFALHFFWTEQHQEHP